MKTKTQKSKDMEYKKYEFIMSRNGVVFDTREHEAYGRDYARRWADQVEIQENCKIIVKIKSN
jgi:hypothetical protein